MRCGSAGTSSSSATTPGCWPPGSRGYDLEECRFHYRQSLLYTVAPGIAMLGQMQIGGGDARGLADTLILRTLTHAGELDAFATL